MIVDKQHLRLHEAAQEVVLSIDGDAFRRLDSKTQSLLRTLAMFCGCSHVPWFSWEVEDEDE